MQPQDYRIEKITLTKTAKKKLDAQGYYTILLISKGNGFFESENGFLNCDTETALLLKPKTSIRLEHRNDKKTLELLVIHVLPHLLKELSDATCDLERGFAFLPVEKQIVHLSTRDMTLIKNLTNTLLTLLEQEDSFGQELYRKNMLSLVLVAFLRSCIASDHVKLVHQKKELVMDDVFRYIRHNLCGDLSLEALEGEFFVSRHHLCRKFKALTGQTIHSYIVKSRLDLCKKHIESGKPIKEVYALGGFGSYNHFFRAFKKEYGMTPKEYYESLTDE